MKWYGILLAVALLSAMLLAGCGGTDDLDTSSSGGPGSGSARDDHSQAPAHAFREKPLSVHIAEEGTTAATDLCFIGDPVCDTTSPGYRQEFDITNEFEPGVPTDVSLSFEYETGMILGTSYDVTLVAEDATMLHYEEDSEWGHVQIEARLVTHASSSIRIITEAYGNDYTSDKDWTLTVDLEGASETIEPGIPVLVPGHAENHGLNITTTGSGAAGFVLWAGDAAVAINETSNGHYHYQIPEEDRRLDHILLIRPGSTAVTINATGPGPVQQALRALVVEWEPVGTAHMLTAGESESWEFELDRTPLAVGIGIRSSESDLAGGINGTVTGPRGDLFEVGVGCAGCMGWGPILGEIFLDSQWEHRQRTLFGAETLGPGAHIVEVEYNVFMGEIFAHDAQIEVQAYQIVFSQ